MRWIVHSYSRILDEFTRQPPDVVFCFHAFQTFLVEVRRMLLDLGLRLPIVGYTHGSHWDVTDTYRCAINVPRWGRHNGHTERHRNLSSEVLEAPRTITPEGTRSAYRATDPEAGAVEVEPL